MTAQECLYQPLAQRLDTIAATFRNTPFKGDTLSLFRGQLRAAVRDAFEAYEITNQPEPRIGMSLAAQGGVALSVFWSEPFRYSERASA